MQGAPLSTDLIPRSAISLDLSLRDMRHSQFEQVETRRSRGQPRRIRSTESDPELWVQIRKPEPAVSVVTFLRPHAMTAR